MKAYRLILSLMASVAAGPAFSQTTGVVCEEFDQIQLTHVLTPTGPLPTALDPNGVYPYMSYSGPQIVRYLKVPDDLARE